MTKTKCSGSGQQPSPPAPGRYYPECPKCGRQMAAQGRKASRRFENAWQSIPVHYYPTRRQST